jgi:hypothetical protein
VKQIATLDSSFWINAHRAGLLPYVLDTYDLRYAAAVAVELNPNFPSGREFWRQVRAGLLHEAIPATESVHEFGPGERAAINLVLGQPHWILLLDDQRPFRMAVELGISTICTPVLTVSLYTEGRFDARQALTILARLAALQTVSPHLLALALAQLGRAQPEPGGE